MNSLTRIAALAVCLSTACLYAQQPAAPTKPTGPARIVAPIGQVIAPRDTSPIGGETHGGPLDVSNLGTGINYHDGPVMTSNGENVYFIWYGGWSGNTAETILPAFISGLNGSPYFGISSSYFDNSRHIRDLLTMSDQVSDSYSQGYTLSDASLQTVIRNKVPYGGLPLDPNGVYYVLTSADVNNTALGGFCVKQCGYHSHMSIDGIDVKYAFVGNPDRCPGTCDVQTTVSPNNNPGADGMANVMAHELSETVTDPDLNAWYDSSGNEVGDKCAWNFGTEFYAPNGSLANVTLNGKDYLIQQIWLNSASGSCALSFQPKTGFCYKGYVQNIGWQGQVCDGDVAGTVGEGLRMEAIAITAPTGYSVCYDAYLQDIGWQGTVCNGAVAGTEGQSRRMEALEVWLEAGSGHVEYFGQVQNLFWIGPARDGAVIGTEGESLRLEAVAIRLLP